MFTYNEHDVYLIVVKQSLNSVPKHQSYASESPTFKMLRFPCERLSLNGPFAIFLVIPTSLYFTSH